MTRRKTVNRTHRVVRRKEAETIQEARELILPLVPAEHRSYINADWHDERTAGRAWSSISYSCSIYGPGGKEAAEASAPTPAGLVAAVMRALQERHDRAHAAAAAAAKSLVPVRKPFDGEIVEDDERRSSSPPPARLAPRPLPRLTSGG